TTLLACGFLLSGILGAYGPKRACGETPPSAPSEKPEKDKRPVATPEQQKEIKEAIHRLGHKNFSAREQASARLVEMGPLVLPQLCEALRSDDPEIRNRCQAAIDAIEKRNNFKTVNGVEFSVVADKVWKIPKKGEQTKIKLGLSFTNRRKEKVYLYLLDTIR